MAIHTISQHGIKPDEKKAEAIVKMSQPSSIDEVRRLQDMIVNSQLFLNQSIDSLIRMSSGHGLMNIAMAILKKLIMTKTKSW